MLKHDDTYAAGAPSPWVVRFAERIPKGPVLDLACGAGRHVRFLLAQGHSVVAVDRNLSGLADLADSRLERIEADLEAGPWPLGERRFATVVVTNYLWRPLLPRLVAATAPAGLLIYETFALGNERFGKPSNPDFLLRPGELLDSVAGILSVIAYEHLRRDAPHPAVIQHIAAIHAADPTI
jgi:SAM-dependent methyltransferase